MTKEEAIAKMKEAADNGDDEDAHGQADEKRERYSRIKRMATSPKAYKDASGLDGSWILRGSAVHALTFGTPAVAVYDGIRRGKEWVAFQDAHAGSVIINPKECAVAKAMATSAKAAIARLMHDIPSDTPDVIEQEILWDKDGTPFSSTPDLHNPYIQFDLKTTRCARPDFFAREILKHYYHTQGATYREAIEQRYGYKPQNVYIVAVESKSPYDAVVFRLTERLLDLGARQMSLWLEQLWNCQASGHWPGYSDAIVDVDVPDYMLGDDDEDADEDEQNETTEEVAA